jgi:hypothetical protein
MKQVAQSYFFFKKNWKPEQKEPAIVVILIRILNVGAPKIKLARA